MFFGSSKPPKQVFPAPYTQQYIPLSMIPGLGFSAEPEHFIDATTMNTLRVGNDGQYHITGSVNQWAEGDQKAVKDFIASNLVPGSEESERAKEEAARKEAEKEAKKVGRRQTILTTPQGLLAPPTTEKKTLLGA